VTSVFVPQDLAYMKITVAELNAINPRLVPLIAHDRAGFGGGVCCCGVTMFFCLWCGRWQKSLWDAVAIAGTLGFATAVFIHPVVGYNYTIHLAPAVFGLAMFVAGIVASRAVGPAMPATIRDAQPIPDSSAGETGPTPAASR
jgi:hypothetical protein